MMFCKPPKGPNVSPAPASAPPAPPLDDSDPNFIQSVNLAEFPYQNTYGIDGRPGLAPKVSEDYGLSASFSLDKRNTGIARPPLSVKNSGQVLVDGAPLSQWRGDATVRPNTGNINQRVGDPLGSLQEITSFLRWTTIYSTCAAIVWEGFGFPLRLIGSFLTDPAEVVLGGYLGFFCLLVLSAEFNNKDLMENFGFLYYPLPRGLTLLLMGGMCIGILDRWWEFLLGLNFVVVGIGYIYTYIQYPEYRRWTHYNERMPTAWQEAKMYWSGEAPISTPSWADVKNSSTAATAIGFASESQSLLRQV